MVAILIYETPRKQLMVPCLGSFLKNSSIQICSKLKEKAVGRALHNCITGFTLLLQHKLWNLFSAKLNKLAYVVGILNVNTIRVYFRECIRNRRRLHLYERHRFEQSQPAVHIRSHLYLHIPSGYLCYPKFKRSRYKCCEFVKLFKLVFFFFFQNKL